MSIQFSANQVIIGKSPFERSFKPKVLKNWQVPKELCDKYPKRNKGATKVIANDRGHLLPDIPRDKSNVWGSFVGTWQLPKKIDKRTARELNGLTKKEQRLYVKRKKAPQSEENFPLIQNEQSANDSNESEDGNVPKEAIIDQQELLPPVEKRPQSGMPSGDLHCCRKKITTPILNAISNFSLAKKLLRENLQHDPLPDTIAHQMYCKLQSQRNLESDPGLALDEGNYAKGVGWKGYPGYGPTKCTKLKVYRPKTCTNIKNTEKDNNNGARPSTALISNFEKKWRFIRQTKVTPIELAICWDLTPENPQDEPKRSQHIDGSNGSQAPAIFSLVSTPKENPNNDDEDEIIGRPPPNNPKALFEKSEFAEEIHFEGRPKTAAYKNQEAFNYSPRECLKRAKSAYNLAHQEKNTNLCNKSLNHRKSTPNLLADCCNNNNNNRERNLMANRRLCMACEHMQADDATRGKKPPPKGGDFKMAFKAGTMQRSSKAKRQDYPEYWRLSTVYQQSYKPIAARKRPLLQTVFK